MIFISGASGRIVAGATTRAVLLGALLVLAGCQAAQQAASPTAGASAAPARLDPLDAFLTDARPGQEAVVTLPDIGTAPVRVMRAYAAASGRECREVLAGGASRASLFCRDDDQWVAARPLLQGGTARP